MKVTHKNKPYQIVYLNTLNYGDTFKLSGSKNIYMLLTNAYCSQSLHLQGNEYCVCDIATGEITLCSTQARVIPVNAELTIEN
jgi:hypothetical protein